MKSILSVVSLAWALSLSTTAPAIEPDLLYDRGRPLGISSAPSKAPAQLTVSEPEEPAVETNSESSMADEEVEPLDEELP